METTLLFTIGVLIVAVGIIISIALHEIGHLVPAKLFKVRTPQYMIGFGPKIFSRTKGETEYGVKAVPLGGYVSMVGMFPPLSDDEKVLVEELKAEKESTREAKKDKAETDTDTKTKKKKKHGSGSEFFKKKWLSASLDAREEASKEVLDTDEGRMFYQLPVWKKLIIMLGGPAMNGILAFGILAAVISIHGINQTTLTISSVYECLVEDEEIASGSVEDTECDEANESPAMQAGYLPGDTFVEYDGVEPNSWEHVQEITQNNAGVTLPVTLERDGELIDTEVTPLAVPRPVFDDLTGRPEFDDDTGNMVTETVGMSGTSPEVELTRLNPLEAGPMIWDQIEAVSRIIAVLPARLYDVAESTFNEDIERDLDGPVSVVGVGRIAGEMSTLDEMSLEARLASVLTLVSSVNIALMLFNLLIPLPPLDGGHVAGALFEGLRKAWARLRGKPEPAPLDVSKMMPITYLMAFLLLCTGALLILADMVDPISIFDHMDY